MNRTLIATAALVFTACVNDSPLFIKGFHPLPFGQECKEFKLGEVAQGGGSLNIAAVGGYQIGLRLQSEMDPELDTLGDDKILARGTQRNTINLDQINLSYTTVPSSISLEAESEAIWFVIPPGGESPISLGGLIGEKAIEKLATSLPNLGDRAEVRVRLTFSGNIITGGKVVSTPVVFPITVFHGASPPACPAGEIVARTGPCGQVGGQDGAPLCCADPMKPFECKVP